jgi:hypothetical protein
MLTDEQLTQSEEREKALNPQQRFHRNVVAVCPCAGQGEAVYCDDGAVYYFLLNGDQPRVPLEGTAVPGSKRAAEREQLFDEAKVPQWEQVARNLGQILTNTAAWLDESRVAIGAVPTPVDTTELRKAFAKQCAAHGVAP